MTGYSFDATSVNNIQGVSSQDVGDDATIATPIAITAASVPTYLTNDGLTLNTGTDFLASGISQLWDTATNRLDFSDLAIGDKVDVRVDVSITTISNNTSVEVGLIGGIGGLQFQVPFYYGHFKSSGLNRITPTGTLLIRTASTRDNPAAIYVATDGAGLDTCLVGGFLICSTPRLPLGI